MLLRKVHGGAGVGNALGRHVDVVVTMLIGTGAVVGDDHGADLFDGTGGVGVVELDTND